MWPSFNWGATYGGLICVRLMQIYVDTHIWTNHLYFYSTEVIIGKMFHVETFTLSRVSHGEFDTVLHGITLYYIVLHCIALNTPVLTYIMLFHIMFHNYKDVRIMICKLFYV